METKAQKKFYVTVNGQKVEVSEEVYRAYVRPVRAQQRAERRNWRCKVKGQRLSLVRCKKDCSSCPYALQGNNATGNLLSWEALVESGYDAPAEDNMEESIALEEEYSEKITALRTAIGQLNERQRLIVKAVYFDGRSQASIAEELGITQATVSVDLRRALARLKKILKNF